MVVVGITSMPVIAEPGRAARSPFCARRASSRRRTRSGCRRTRVILKHILWLNCRAPARDPGDARHGRGDPDRDQPLLPRLRRAGADALVGQHGPGRRELLSAGRTSGRRPRRRSRSSPPSSASSSSATASTTCSKASAGDDAARRIENLRTYFYSRAKRAFVRSVDGASLARRRAAKRSAWWAKAAAARRSPRSRRRASSPARPGVIGGRIEFASPRNLLEGLERYVQVEERDGRVMAVEKDERGWRKLAERLMAGRARQGDRHDLPEPARGAQSLCHRRRAARRGDPAAYPVQKQSARPESGRCTGSSACASTRRGCASTTFPSACRAACASAP